MLRILCLTWRYHEDYTTSYVRYQCEDQIKRNVKINDLPEAIQNIAWETWDLMDLNEEYANVLLQLEEMFNEHIAEILAIPAYEF